MKADLTRDTFRPEQHFARVVFPQGHALTEAELNEQAQIQLHRDSVTNRDVIGESGAPNGASFELSVSPDGRDLLVHRGRYYVAGKLVEGEADTVVVTSPSAGVLQLPALTLDGRPLVAGEWLEVTSPSAPAHRFQIASLDAATRRVTLGANDVGPSPDSSPVGTANARARRVASYVVQPDWPRPTGTTWPAAPALPSVSLAPGVYGAYLDVFQYHVTGIADPAQREVALGGVDGASRDRTVWQLKLNALGPVGTPATCAQVLPASMAGATVAARAKRPATGTNPCIIEPAARYRRLENQLYRVEIHQGGTLGVDANLTFKWSRENASVVMPWLASTSTELTLATVGRDSKLGLAAGDWLELLDDQRELSRTPGTLMQIDSVEGTAVRIKAGTATGTTAIADYPFHPRVRRWDHAGAAALSVTRPATNDGYLAIEDGVEVRFDDGVYRAGDHWLIPARTLTLDIEWPRDLDGLPVAERSHHGQPVRVPLAVVEWTGTVMKVLSDCRKQFPPLTDIHAKDVRVDNDPCDRGWTTVQEALEDLCHDNDLEFHNQHLHGWGVVCGLQVQCMTEPYADSHPRITNPKEWVLLRDGYAIHPTGADIRVHSAAGDTITAFDLAQLAIDEKVIVRNPDGSLPNASVSLWIDKGNGPIEDRLHVDPYDPSHKPTWTELLEGTILVDIYNDCVLKVIEFFKHQFDAKDNDKVGVRARRLIAVINLFWQLVNQTSGKHIFLSGDVKEPASKFTEDGLLRELFEGLKDLLQSKSFCAMFDDIAFPDYDIYRDGLDAATPEPTTIFGKDHHNRIRVHPRRQLAFTCGNGNLVNVYDLATNRFLASTPFPTTSSEVHDVAFGLVGSEIYAIAWIGDAKVDSVFAVGNVNNDGTITWTGNQVQCSLKLVTLAVDAGSPGKVFAAARGKGIYVFDLTKPNELPAELSAFAASGHLVATRRTGTVLYAGAHATQANPVAFTHVFGIRVDAPNTKLRYELPDNGNTPGSAHDDLALAIDVENKVDELYAIADATNQSKRLVVWNPADAAASTAPGAQPVRVVGLGNSWTSRVAYSAAGNWCMVTYEDTYKGRAYRPGHGDLETGMHPLQIGPVSVATDVDGKSFYVLNWLSNTITVVPATASAQSPWQSTVDVTALQTYRWKAIVAFLKAIGRFAQFLKDCVCEHMLINCPKPEGKKVYLADISFKNGKIYQICNFHHRRYVHTFPTVEYWMSFVPVIPMLKQAVEKVCCSVISGFFDKLAPPQDPAAAKKDNVPVTMLRHGVTYSKQANLSTEYRTRKSQLSVAGLFGKTMLQEKLWQPAPGVATASMATFDVVNKNEADARASAETAGVKVMSVKTVESDVAPTFKTLMMSPKVRSGDNVELILDRSGKVVGMEKVAVETEREQPVRMLVRAPAGAGTDAATAADTAALRSELAEMRTKMAEMEAVLEKLRG